MVIGAEITLPDGTMNFGEKSCYNSLQAQLVNGLAGYAIETGQELEEGEE